MDISSWTFRMPPSNLFSSLAVWIVSPFPPPHFFSSFSTTYKKWEKKKALTPKISDIWWELNRFYGVEEQGAWTLDLFLPPSSYRLSGKLFTSRSLDFLPSIMGSLPDLEAYETHLFIHSFKTLLYTTYVSGTTPLVGDRKRNKIKSLQDFSVWETGKEQISK